MYSHFEKFVWRRGAESLSSLSGGAQRLEQKTTRKDIIIQCWVEHAMN